MTAEQIRVAVAGLGWIGRQAAEAALDDNRVRLVGTADIDLSRAERDLGELIGRGRIGIPVFPSISELLARTRPEVTILCIGSRLEVVGPALNECVSNGSHVVTDCERLVDPAQIPAQLDPSLPARLQEAGLVVLATGANPGFAMDRLPLLLAQASRKIRRMRVQRVIRAEDRRAQLQARVGLGMSPHHFRQAITSGEVGLPGLSTSVQLLARGMGVQLSHTAESISPVLAASPINSEQGTVASGQVRGVYQVARGHTDGRELITLELKVALGEPDPRDTVHIVGEPPLFLRTELPTEACTVATLLSACPLLGGLRPGFRTILDLPLMPTPDAELAAPPPSLAAEAPPQPTAAPRPVPVQAEPEAPANKPLIPSPPTPRPVPIPTRPEGPRATNKKTAARTKKATAKKATAKKATAKKATTKKSRAKKTAAKKLAAKKLAAKKLAAKKLATKKSTAKKAATSAQEAEAKKPGAKKPGADRRATPAPRAAPQTPPAEATAPTRDAPQE